MTSSQFTYHKDKLSKSLLAVTIFLSCFAFTGYSGTSKFQQQKAGQTEIIYSPDSGITKHIFLYKKLFETKTCILNPTRNNFLRTLLIYNKLIKLRISHISKTFYSLDISVCYIQRKTIPQSSSEDRTDLLVG